MFHQYSTAFTFPPLKNISKHLFIIWDIVILCSFTFKSPTLHKYASASSLSKSSKFLILQFLVKCCKLHSVFKILSHMLHIFLVSSVCYKCSYKLWFHSLKSLDSPNLYINWANMWYPDHQNKKLSLCIFKSFKGFHFCIKWAIMWYLDNQLRKKTQSVHATASK